MQQRAVPQAAVDSWQQRVERLEEQVESILWEEREEKALRKAEMEVQKVGGKQECLGGKHECLDAGQAGRLAGLRRELAVAGPAAERHGPGLWPPLMHAPACLHHQPHPQTPFPSPPPPHTLCPASPAGLQHAGPRGGDLRAPSPHLVPDREAEEGAGGAVKGGSGGGRWVGGWAGGCWAAACTARCMECVCACGCFWLDRHSGATAAVLSRLPSPLSHSLHPAPAATRAPRLYLQAAATAATSRAATTAAA